MFKTKSEVDKHVGKIFLKSKSESDVRSVVIWCGGNELEQKIGDGKNDKMNSKCVSEWRRGHLHNSSKSKT